MKNSENNTNKLSETKRRVNNVLAPLEMGTWFMCTCFAFACIVVSLYGTAGNLPLLLQNMGDALPVIALGLVPGAAVSLGRIGTNVAIKRAIRNKDKRLYKKNLYNQAKVDYVTTRYNDSIDRIIILAKSNDKPQIKSVAKEMKKIEKTMKLTPREEIAVEENILRYAQNIKKDMLPAERKQLAKVFKGIGR